MRKIWWLSVMCVAAGAVQALFAADEPSPTARKGFLGGRSRLLIYSKNKNQVRKPEVATDDATPTARASVSDDSEVAPERPVRVPTGNTGTVSPSSRTTRPVPVLAPKPRSLITSGAGIDKTPASQLPAAKAPIAKKAPIAVNTSEFLEVKSETLTNTDDAAARSLFEDVEPVALPKKPVGGQPVSRPESTARVEIESAPFASAIETPPAAAPVTKSPPASDQARKAARYKELLESVRPGNEAHAPETVSNKKVQEPIQPVSGSESRETTFEVNPFEPSERPTEVVNAGFKEEAGKNTQQRIVTTSAASAAPKVTSEKAPAAKATVTKLPEIKKPIQSTTDRIAKPISKSNESTAKAVTHSAPPANNQAPQVDVTLEARGEVTLGEQCQCVLIVKNNGKVSAREIIVEASFPESVQLIESVPFPKSSSSKLEWQFGNLAAGEQKTIELTMVPTKRGELGATAQVRFTGTAATSFQVSEPMLTATVKLAKEVHLGEPAGATVTVSNPGTGTAQNVVVHAVLPKGLESSSGKEFSTEIGPLGPGESRTVRLGMIATAGGDQTVKVIAKSSTGTLEHTTQAQIKVLAPSLKLAATGPSLRYMHRAAKYAVTVTNNSNTSTENVRLTQVVAAGFDYVKADHGGRWDSASRTVSWYVGHLDAGQSTTVELELMPQKLGEYRHSFKVSGDAGAESTTVVATRVEGAASLVMEVKDADDPIEIGSEMTYEIQVRNEGSKSASKVAISCELPPDVELVKVDGPTGHIVESGVLIFKQAAELAARESLIYKITIKGTVAGTTKLRARLTSESIQKPLIVEEATQFYAE